MHIEINTLKIMPRSRESRYTALCELKALSKEADNFAEELSYEAALDAWFSSARETVLKIKDCKTEKELENVVYPPEISTILKPHKRSNESVIAEFPEKQKEHVHDVKQTTEKNEVAKIKQMTEIKSSEILGSSTKDNGNSITSKTICTNQITETEPISTDDKEIEKKSKKNLCPMTKVVESQLLQENTPKMPSTYKKNTIINTVSNSRELMQTPVANRTFIKTLNTTIVLDSSDKSNHSSNCAYELKNKTMILRSGSKKISTNKNSDNTHENEMRSKTRSHSKRKSSDCKTASNKKRKLEVRDAPVVSATKAAKRKYPIINKAVAAKTSCAYDNKAKISAVIVPSLQVKQAPIPSKEKQILEEIKKKEEKANENRKKVLAERQMKAEETKKKREEKQEKIQQKRLQMEKEKDEKRELELKKSPIKAAKKAPLKRVKELIEQNTAKEKKSGVLTSSKQNEANILKQNECPVVLPPKTPTSQKSFDSENYELTPMPDSSTYDFSEDEDDKPSGKPIPLWAQGVHLKADLVKQYYDPPNTDEIFGSYIESPDLTELFGIHKKCYKLRTSSAIWNSPPARSLNS